MERSVQADAVQSLIHIATRCGRDGYSYMPMPYTRTDEARNAACLGLARIVRNPNDTLVMLDCDHDHPADVVQRLTAHDVGVVGALYFRRSEPYDAMCFVRGEDGQLHTPAEWDEDAGLAKVACVGTGAIAIQAWVFQELMAKGYEWPWFRYGYNPGGTVQPSEDMYFGDICEKAGIPHHVDLSLLTRHLTVSSVDRKAFDAYKNHPERRAEVEVVDATLHERYPWFDRWNQIDGWLHASEGIHLYETALAVPSKPGRIVELGTWRGRSTVAIGLAAREVGAFVTSIDDYSGVPGAQRQPDVDAARANLQAFGLQNIVRLIVGDTQARAQRWPKSQPLDMLFVDAGHDEEQVYADALAWLDNCRVAAHVLFHDHVPAWPGVVKAVARLADEGRIVVKGQYGSIAHCMKTARLEE